MEVTERAVMPSVVESEMAGWADFSIPEFPVSSNGWALIALEAWRRGLAVEIRGGYRFSVGSGSHQIPFRLSRLATSEAQRASRVCSDKNETKRLMAENGVPVPHGKVWQFPFDIDSIVSYAQSLGFPVCLKANGWSKGKGVYAKVENEDHFISSFNALTNELGCEKLIVETHFAGEDFRLFVVGDRVAAATRRVPANVVGDGVRSVSALVAAKNRLRSQNPYLRGALIQMGDEAMQLLQAQGLKPSSVPQRGQFVQLRHKANASSGGDSIDVTERVSKKLRDLAVRAVEAVPGLCHGGVDLLVDDYGAESERAVVIEINQAAEMGIHYYPFEGRGRFPPSDIIDYYFGSSCLFGEFSEYWYFDLKAALGLINRGVADSVAISPRPRIDSEAWCQLVCRGLAVTSQDLRQFAKSLSRAGLHGDIRRGEDEVLFVRMVGSAETVNQFSAEAALKEYFNEVSGLSVLSNEPFVLVPGFRVA